MPGEDRPIGRERELAELATAAAKAGAGRGGLVAVTGEAGIGKSRLVEELADIAAGERAALRWGRCWEAGGAPAFWPWIQVLRSVFADGFPKNRLEAFRSGALTQILPELGSAQPEGNDLDPLEPDQARFQLMDSVCGVLAAASADQPMVIVLEDLHAADPASITMLDFVARQLRTLPILVVATYREAGGPGGRAGEGIARISREARSVLRLTRLSRDEVVECVERATGTRPGPRIAGAIHEASEGNPLFVVEIAGLMAARGLLEGDDRVDIAIPDGVAAVIRERAAGLTDQTLVILETASILGREFLLPDLALLLEMQVEAVDAALVEAIEKGVVERGDGGCHRYAHILIREVFHSGLEDRRRRALHLRRAEDLQEKESAGQIVATSELAHHLLEAGPEAESRAFEASLRAADDARAQLAFDDAADFLGRAILVFDRLPDGDPSVRCGLMLDRAQALLKGGEVAAGRTLCSEGAATARLLGDADLLARAALISGDIFVIADVDPALVELLDEALTKLEEGDSAIRARVQARLAAAMQPAEDPQVPMELAREAIAMARRIGDRETLLEAIRSGCSALMDLADPAERLLLNREHVELAAELGRPLEGLRAHMRIVIDVLELGDMAACDAAIDACARLASRTGLPHHLWPVASFRAMRASMAGDFDRAELFAEEARREAERTQDPNAARTLAMQRIGIARMREAFEEVADRLKRMRRDFDWSGFLGFISTTLEGDLFARMGRHEEIPEGLLASVLDKVLSLGDRSTLCTVAEMAAGSDDRELAQRVYERLQAWSGQCATWGLFGLVFEGPIDRYLALLASGLGRNEQAEDHFRSAIEEARRIGARPLVARASYEFGLHLMRNNASPEFSAQLLTEARSIAEELGQLGLLELIGSVEHDHHRGDQETGRETARMVPSMTGFSLERDGELWVCRCQDTTFTLKDTKGVQILAALVAEPGREIHVLELSGSAPPDQAVDGGDAGVILDATAKIQYQQRVEELRAEIEEAESFNDPGRISRAREELDAIAAELSRAFGLGGRERRTGKAAERARVNVQRRLRDAVKRIAEHCPDAGKHLDWALKTGTFCVYDPG